MVNGHGGARDGAGRPPKAVHYSRQIAASEKKIAANLNKITEAMIQLAVGVWVEETDKKTGEPRIYQRAPNFKAGMDLMNRIMGRPREEAEEPEAEPEPPSHDFALLSKQELDALKTLLEKATPSPDASGGSGRGEGEAKP